MFIACSVMISYNRADQWYYMSTIPLKRLLVVHSALVVSGLFLSRAKSNLINYLYFKILDMYVSAILRRSNTISNL